MRLTTREYLLATVAYADVFDYPLTEDDAYFWFIHTTPSKNFRSFISKGILRYQHFLFLKGRKKILATYEDRHRISKHKWQIARKVGSWLRFVPTIQLVGVTGGLALNNSDRNDDIDFFFITSKRAIWISRLLAIVIVELLGRRRKPNDLRVADKICLNMFMSEDALRLSKSEQDLFAAHEVLQMEPLWARGDSYWNFLRANAWVKTFLPVAWGIKKSARNNHPKSTHWWTLAGVSILRLIEWPVKIIQLWYMSRHLTGEVISDSVLRFHPRDARSWIRDKFIIRLFKYNMPIDKIYGR
jgi:hypothetical protein